MTIQTYRVRRLRIAEETTFGTDLTGTINSFIHLAHTTGTVTIQQPRVQPNTMQQKMDSTPYDVLTEQKRATATITCNLTGQPSRAGNGTTHTQCAQGMLLRSYMGAQRLGQGDLYASGSSTNILNVATGARWEQGAGIAYLLTGGRLRARHITQVSSNALTCYPDMDDLPSAAEIAYAAATYYLGASDQDSSENKTIQLIAEGLVTHDRHLLLGGKVTGVTFTFTRGQIATVQYTIQFVDWIYGEDAATDLTSDTAPLAYVAETSNGSPLTVHDSDLIWTDGTTADPIVLNASEISIGCENAWVPVPSTTGVNGVIGWARNHSPGNINASFAIPFEDRTWQDYRDTQGSGSSGGLHFQVGSSATQGACLFCLGGTQVRDAAIVEVDGLTYQRVSLVGGLPITTDITEIADSPFNIHMF